MRFSESHASYFSLLFIIAFLQYSLLGESLAWCILHIHLWYSNNIMKMKISVRPQSFLVAHCNQHYIPNGAFHFKFLMCLSILDIPVIVNILVSHRPLGKLTILLFSKYCLSALNLPTSLNICHIPRRCYGCVDTIAE